MSGSQSTNQDTVPSDELGATEEGILESAQRGLPAAIVTTDQVIRLAKRHRRIAEGGC